MESTDKKRLRVVAEVMRKLDYGVSLFQAVRDAAYGHRLGVGVVMYWVSVELENERFGA